MTVQTPTLPPVTPLSGPALEPETFRRIAAIAYDEAGLAIAPSKSAMVRTRLARRLRQTGLPDFEQYCDYVSSDSGQLERREMISALTTNVSHFFRESHHFDRLRTEVLPPLFERLKAGGRVRIWSAGCSNGQEPYSIAMTVLDMPGYRSDFDLRILATDIDPKVLTQAESGSYHTSMLDGLSDAMKSRHFKPTGGADPQWQATPALRELVVFRELNLLRNWPMRGRFDVIFCRNVVIYFDQETQNQLWQRFAEALAPEGWLFLGHSERVSDRASGLFAGQGLTAYRKPAGATLPRPGRNH